MEKVMKITKEKEDKQVDNARAENKELRAEDLAGAGVSVQVVITKDKDSITLGAPTSGQIKVHGDFTRPQSFAHKLEVAQKLMAEARARVEVKKNGE